MDRNCPDFLREKDAKASALATLDWLRMCRTISPCKTDDYSQVCAHLFG